MGTIAKNISQIKIFPLCIQSLTATETISNFPIGADALARKRRKKRKGEGALRASWPYHGERDVSRREGHANCWHFANGRGIGAYVAFVLPRQKRNDAFVGLVHSHGRLCRSPFPHGDFCRFPNRIESNRVRRFPDQNRIWKRREIRKRDIFAIVDITLGKNQCYVVYPKGYDSDKLAKHTSKYVGIVERAKLIQRDKRLLIFTKTKRMSELFDRFGYTVTIVVE